MIREKKESYLNRISNFRAFFILSPFLMYLLAYPIGLFLEPISAPLKAEYLSNAGFYLRFIKGCALFILFLILDERDIFSDKQSKSALIGSPLLGFIIGKAIAQNSIIIFHALLNGHNIEFSYKVDDIYLRRRWCHPKIYLAEMPYDSNSYCPVSQELAASLKPGDTVIIEGYGTEYGLIPRSIRKAN